MVNESNDQSKGFGPQGRILRREKALQHTAASQGSGVLHAAGLQLQRTRSSTLVHGKVQSVKQLIPATQPVQTLALVAARCNPV
jgi:hypothetical protein